MKYATKMSAGANPVPDHASRKPLPYFFQRPDIRSIGPDVTSLTIGEAKKDVERSENGCGETKLFAAIKF